MNSKRFNPTTQIPSGAPTAQKGYRPPDYSQTRTKSLSISEKRDKRFFIYNSGVIFGTILIVFIVMLFISTLFLTGNYLNDPVLLKNDPRRNVTLGSLWFGTITTIVIAIGLSSLISLETSIWWHRVLLFLLNIGGPLLVLIPAITMLSGDQEMFNSGERVYLGAASGFSLTYPLSVVLVIFYTLKNKRE